MNNKLIKELENIIKNLIKEENISEIEKYTPTIDTPEEEKELKKIWGIKEKDPYKIKNPYKTLKSDDFYEKKLKDFKLKNTKKNIIPNIDTKIKNDKEYRDIKYLGNWEKTSDNTPHYDEYNKIYLNKIDKIEKERTNKEKEEIKQKDKTKIELRKDIKQIINNIILKNRENKPDLIVKDFKLIPHKYPKYFTNTTKTFLYTQYKEEIKNILKTQNKSQNLIDISRLYNKYLFLQKNVTQDLISAYKNNQDIINILNDLIVINDIIKNILNSRKLIK